MLSWLTTVGCVGYHPDATTLSSVAADVDGGFEMRRPDGVSAAEICHAGGDNAGIPPVWILSLPVDDFEESLRLVREAGGVFTDLEGRPPGLETRSVLAANPALHARLLELFND